MSAGNERNGLLVVHRHAGKSLPDSRAAASGSGSPFVLPDSHRSDPFARQRADSQDRGRRCSARRPATCPQDPSRFLFGFPTSSRPPPKPNVFKAHRIEGDVAGENHKVAQEIFRPYFCLSATEAGAPCRGSRYRPAIERREALLPSSGAAAAVAYGTYPRCATPCE